MYHAVRDGDITVSPTGFGTFIGVGVGIGMRLIVVLALVGLIVILVMVKRRAANKNTGSMKMRNNSSYYNPVVIELEVKGVGADNEDADKDKANGSVVDGFNPYEDVDSKVQMKNTKKPAPKESSTSASATNAPAIYAIVDKSKKKGAKKKQVEYGCTVTNKDDLYTVPMKKIKMADEGKATSGRVHTTDTDLGWSQNVTTVHTPESCVLLTTEQSHVPHCERWKHNTVSSTITYQ